MDDEVGLGCTGHSVYPVFDDVELLDINLRILPQLLNPFGIAQHKVVETNNLANAQLVSRGSKKLHHVVAQKTATASDKHRRVLKFRTLNSRESS